MYKSYKAIARILLGMAYPSAFVLFGIRTPPTYRVGGEYNIKPSIAISNRALPRASLVLPTSRRNIRAPHAVQERPGQVIITIKYTKHPFI